MARTGARHGAGNGQSELGRQTKSSPNGSAAISYTDLTDLPVPRMEPEFAGKLKQKPGPRVTSREYTERCFSLKAQLVLAAGHRKEPWALEAMAQPALPSTRPGAGWVEHFGFAEYAKNDQQGFRRLLRRRFGFED